MNKIVYVGKHALTMAVSRHLHNSWELIYCTSGNGKMIFGDATLEYPAPSATLQHQRKRFYEYPYESD